MMTRLARIIPSALSILRIPLAVCLPLVPERYWLILIAAAAGSDFVDGWLAQSWRVTSWQGGLIDAFADKVFILVTVAVYAKTGKFSLWWILPVVVRDIMVAVTVLYALVRREWAAFKEMDARISGKLTTCGQFTLFAVVLLFPQQTFSVLLLASCLSIIAGCDYGWLFYLAVRNRP